MPDSVTRDKIFKVHTREMPLDKSVNLATYINKTEGLTGADIAAICRNAGLNAIKKYYKSKQTSADLIVTQEDFDSALESIARHIVTEKLDDKPARKIVPLKRQ
jgi:transitional endoplasmic reticulum ATPase